MKSSRIIILIYVNQGQCLAKNWFINFIIMNNYYSATISARYSAVFVCLSPLFYFIFLPN